MKLLNHFLAWLHGWRYDLDGWLVRARHETDPDELDCSLGFVEESAIAVRSIDIAIEIDSKSRQARKNRNG